MKEWAQGLYLSAAWRRARDYIYDRDNGMCVRCGAIGEEVHHIRHLTPQNINDSYIAFSADNLQLLCRECHRTEHEGKPTTAEGLTFDAAGNLVERGNCPGQGGNK